MRLIPRLLMDLLLTAALAASAQTLTFLQVLDRPDRPQPDMRLAYGDTPQQFGELWLLKGKGPHPVALMIHGGCWQASLPGPERWPSRPMHCAPQAWPCGASVTAASTMRAGAIPALSRTWHAAPTGCASSPSATR